MSASGNHRFPLPLRLAFAAVLMFGFGFAMVPLYDIFCEVTGIRTPIVANDASAIEEKPEQSRNIRLEMLANTNGGAPWEFGPENDSQQVQTGMMQEIDYIAVNLTDEQLVAVATPDVRPAEAGKYFKKIECFCFNEQEFAANEEKIMPVRFYIEPDLPAHIDTITLAYTLYQKPGKVASKN
ncbi:MAG: cytochrome c oxidase assembly protein [Gammaproteobacteria bacterium]